MGGVDAAELEGQEFLVTREDGGTQRAVPVGGNGIGGEAVGKDGLAGGGALSGEGEVAGFDGFEAETGGGPSGGDAVGKADGWGGRLEGGGDLLAGEAGGFAEPEGGEFGADFGFDGLEVGFGRGVESGGDGAGTVQDAVEGVVVFGGNGVGPQLKPS